MKPEVVARATHRALLMRHWPLVTPGLIYMVLGACMRVIPGSLLTPLMGLLYKQSSAGEESGDRESGGWESGDAGRKSG